MRRRIAILLVLAAVACSRETERQATPPPAPVASILLVTLDTTRADAVGPDGTVPTPSINSVIANGTRFTQAYAASPQTLPAHTSMMTGLYPAGHAIRENGRYLAAGTPVLAERLKEKGYATAAFVSAFVLARRFGLGRGFDTYDDDFGRDREERAAPETTDRALEFLRTHPRGPLFIWVHYYDPHFPYTPAAPFLAKYPDAPYRGEVALMDHELGRLLDAFRSRAGGSAGIILAGDHGEGLGDHGEAQHGNLLYQSTMHVPFIVAGPGFRATTETKPVSTRSIFHTILRWAGTSDSESKDAVVLGEAMKPFLDYGWQPQTMGVEGNFKTILSGGKAEVYDVVADPKESHDLAATAGIQRATRAALRDYPAPSTASAKPPVLSDEEQKKLASLGYVAATAAPTLRHDAPRPSDMTRLFDDLDAASARFVRGGYREAIPFLEKILAADPHNLDSALRLAVSYSALGRDRDAEEAFKRAEAIAPDSADVRMYLALHLARGPQWERATPLLERTVREDPDRLPALEALAVIRERQGRLDEAVELRGQMYSRRSATAAELLRLGAMAMELGRTPLAIESFEKARALQGGSFEHDLELGVLYLASRRLEDARRALDRVPQHSPAFPMAAFKRAQVAVLLHEPDARERIGTARRVADATTRELISGERLFQ